MDLTVSDRGMWNMTGDSEVTSLEHSRGGVINMNASPAYETLHSGSYTGNGGIFLMKTDLDSEKDGDKVTIDSAADDFSGLIMVKDSSLYTGKEVKGIRNLLLVTGASGKARFEGKDLEQGGLWDVTPVIKRGNEALDAEGNAVGDHTEWYLTKVEKKVNKDTIPLIKAPDNSYALYRLDIDSLRKRMGDFRFRNLKDTSGI
jgi:outer membrane autotransporter protein